MQAPLLHPAAQTLLQPSPAHQLEQLNSRAGEISCPATAGPRVEAAAGKPVEDCVVAVAVAVAVAEAEAEVEAELDPVAVAVILLWMH